MESDKRGSNAPSPEGSASNHAPPRPSPPPSSQPTQIPKVKPMFVDIHEHFDYSLLKRFYDELMIPNFPMEDELEPLENWVKMFTEGAAEEEEDDGSKEQSNYETPDFHVVIALHPMLDPVNGTHAILGGVVYEYYRSNNCGCLTYLLVSEHYRGKGLAADLIHQAVGSLETNAKTRGHLAGCNAIFLETNSAEKVSAADDVMDPSVRHRVFHRLGFRLVDFDYVQPPLSVDVKKCRTLLLTILITPHIPKQTVGTEEKFYIPSALVMSFIRAFWDSCCTRLGYRFWTSDVDYVRMMDQLSRRSRVPLLDLPWDRPWYLVDLREHYDLELLVRFYQDVLAPNFHRRAELEPLESWLRMLPRYPGAKKQRNVNVQKAQNMPDFHVLLSLIYPQDDSPSAPMIAGGLAFEYYSGTNCGLLTYMIVRHGNAERMGRALTRRAVEILDADAIARGHVAGCNAIFLESPASIPQGLHSIPKFSPSNPLAVTSAIDSPSSIALNPTNSQTTTFANPGHPTNYPPSPFPPESAINMSSTAPPAKPASETSGKFPPTINVSSTAPPHKPVDENPRVPPTINVSSTAPPHKPAHEISRPPPDSAINVSSTAPPSKSDNSRFPPNYAINTSSTAPPSKLVTENSPFPPESAINTSSTAPPSKPPMESFQEMQENMKYEEISNQHVLLSKMGWRLVDFGYIPPPLSYEGRRLKHGQSLLTLFTNRIPSEEMHGASKKYYLPKSLLQNFVTEFWSSSAARVQHDYINDEDFKKMRDDLSRREKIPLLDLPWERPWTLIDLGVDYDRELLASYYTTLLLPNSPRPEKHEPLEHWQSMLESQNPHFHVVLALDNSGTSSKIVGGLTFEYYDEVNCGFLTYLNVSGERVYDMGRLLVVYAVSILDQDAQARGHIAGCNSIFLETLATSPAHFKEHDLTQNHTALWRMGFRLVDIDYVQPPLSKGTDTTKNLSLTILLTPRIPHIPHEEGGYVYNYLPNTLLQNFITTQWHTAAQRLNTNKLLRDADYLRMVDQISRRSKIPLYDTPWERSWTTIDMREDFDMELLKTFYDAIPNKDELEPMDHWVRMLTPEHKHDPRTEDLHVLLALRYSNPSRIRPDVSGGLTFEYFPVTNCGFLTYLMVPSGGTESEVMGRELVEEAVEVLDQNARDRGHVVGVNVIFMESSLDPRTHLTQAHSTSESTPKRLYMDFSHHHTMLHKIGWRALDFFFVQPPLSPKSKTGKPTLLTAFLAPTIPRDDNGNHFIPSSLLRSFITAYWTNTCGRVGYPFKKDHLYKKMMHELHERVRIPLVDLRDRELRPKL